MGLMEFTCNPIKNETNIRDRGLPLLTARLLFNSLAGTRRYPQGLPEAAFYRLYNTTGGRLMVVVFCGPADDHIHIILFRKANRREQTKIENQTL
jgi:uncharacterized DUF497 family protein